MTAVDGGLSARVRVERGGFRLDVALAADPGETVAVMGPSGAGKSTLLGALAGLVPLAGGEVRVGDRILDAAGGRGASGDAAGRGSSGDSAGRGGAGDAADGRTGDAADGRGASGDVAGGRGRAGRVRAGRAAAGRAAAGRVHVAPAARGVVLLGQEPRLFPHLTVRENVAFGPRAQGVPAVRARAEADEWLRRVGLPDRGGERPGELSGGQQQRVAVARALATGPEALLLDEPLTSLDPETAGGIRDVLRELLGTAVVATHDALDAVVLARRLVVVEDGRVVQSGPVREVLAAPATPYVAAIAGVNRVLGVARGGRWVRDGVVLEASDAASRAAAADDGVELVAIFSPSAARLVPLEALGTGAGDGATTVRRLDPTPAGVRVRTELCDVDIPVEDAAGLASGSPVGVRVAAADVRLRRAAQRIS
ncbi:sulfate/molybdate ABC transporter ATP-binding protein [Microbacterium sp.]|uniref:sulfate/molybdate ABC transporter ATP-binding protein n=1 Tax=Microbacterium sp. TaxID=51671 RepID=UPI000B069597|nr:ATP-binding cassette domain-containing protein [Microbacterium sp.]